MLARVAWWFIVAIVLVLFLLMWVCDVIDLLLLRALEKVRKKKESDHD
jgi:hypothetical protein